MAKAQQVDGKTQYWCLEHEWGPHPDVPPTKESLDAECAAETPYYERDGTFIPGLWVEYRKRGIPPCCIDYDMCHVFR